MPYSCQIASNFIIPEQLIDRKQFVETEKVTPIDLPDGLLILVPRGYANEIAVKLPNQYILDLPEDLDIQKMGRKIMFSQYT